MCELRPSERLTDNLNLGQHLCAFEIDRALLRGLLGERKQAETVGYTGARPVDGTIIPEPTGMALSLTGGMIMVSRRRSRSAC